MLLEAQGESQLSESQAGARQNKADDQTAASNELDETTDGSSSTYEVPTYEELRLDSVFSRGTSEIPRLAARESTKEREWSKEALTSSPPPSPPRGGRPSTPPGGQKGGAEPPTPRGGRKCIRHGGDLIACKLP